MDWSKGEYDAWQAGWMLGKYQHYTRFPIEPEFEDWLAGFHVGTAEVCEYHIWPTRLREYTHGKVVPHYLLLKLNDFDKLDLPPDPSEIESHY